MNIILDDTFHDCLTVIFIHLSMFPILFQYMTASKP